MNGLIIEIKNTAGKWLINGKRYIECSFIEQKYFDNFIRGNRQLIERYGNIKGIC